ncbi:MAG: M48 family metallopeptidase [Alphaproteobacteria bacterium]|nr:M48 family metallopeptidase [Alphaproteobacteria bacterium]
MAAGLQNHIWNNNLRSIILLALYPLMIAAIVWACTFVIGAAGTGDTGERAAGMANALLYAYWPLIFTVVALWFLIAWFFHGAMIRKLAHSHPVTRKEEPALYNLLENLCIAQGMPMPRLEIIETHARNAFASGIDEKSYCVTVTRGLLNSLTKDEVEAVLAHELTHILNRDVRLLIITVIFTGMIGFAAQIAWSNIRYGMLFSGRNRKNGSGIMVIFAIAAILWLGYLATLFTRFALSRSREYMADAGAVKMTKNPEAMMSALMRIAGRDKIPETTDDIAMMCIENHKPFLGLFATHPPIKSRILAISETTNTPAPDIFSTPPAPTQDRFHVPDGPKNPWLIRERGQRKKSR